METEQGKVEYDISQTLPILSFQVVGGKGFEPLTSTV